MLGGAKSRARTTRRALALFLNIQSENIPFDVPTLDHKYFNSSCHNSVNYWWSLMHLAQHTKWVKINLMEEESADDNLAFDLVHLYIQTLGLKLLLLSFTLWIKARRKGCIIRISYVRYYLLGPTLDGPKINTPAAFLKPRNECYAFDTPNNGYTTLIYPASNEDDFLSINRSCVVSSASKA